MAKKSAHPDIQLFDFLNGALDEKTAMVIEAHLTECEECASVAGLVRSLKESASQTNRERQSHTSGEHPGISELASFFYTQSQSADSCRAATHVSMCSSCAEAIAQYARAERASAEYEPAKAIAGEVPAKAWDMINDWEDSSFGKLKPASEVLGQELLDRLVRLLNKRDVREMDRDASQAQDTERIPVLIVSSSGEVRSVEFFEKHIDPTGASILRHSEGSARFDNKPLHALFDFGERDPLVVSNVMHRDTVRLEQTRPEEESRRANYIIIED